MGFFTSKATPVTQRQTQTSQTGPWAGAQPAIANSLDQLQQYSGGYQGPYATGFTPWQNEAMSGIVNQARQGTPLAPAAETATLGGLQFANPFMDPMRQFGMTSTAAGQRGLLDTAFGDPRANPYLTGAMEAAYEPLEQRFTQDIAPGLAATFSGGGRLRGGDSAAANAMGRATEAFGRGVGQATMPFLNQSAENEAARRQAALGQLYGGGRAFLGTGAQTASDAERLRQSAVGIAPTAYNLGFADLNQILSMGDRQQALADLDIQRRMDQYNRDVANTQGIARTAGGLGSTFGDTTGTRTSTRDVFRKPLGTQLLGMAGTLAGSFLGGP